MGASFASNETYSTVEDFTRIINNFSTSIIEKSALSISSIQEIRILSGVLPNGKVCPVNFNGANFNVNNKNVVTSAFTASNVAKISNTVKNELSQEITNWIDSKLEQKDQWMTFAINYASSKQISKTEIVNDITTNISSNISQTCSDYIGTTQLIEYYFCGFYTNYNTNIEQQSAAISLANCLNSAIIVAAAQNSVIQDILQKTDAAIAQQSTTLDQVIITVVVVVVIAGVITTLAYYYFSSNSNVRLNLPPAQSYSPVFYS